MLWTRYAFWLAIVSALCFAAERLRPWRRDQSWRRPQLGQDLFWLVFNGAISGLILADPLERLGGLLTAATAALVRHTPEHVRVVASLPLWAQVVVVLVLADLIEWCIHNLLHRTPWLWRFHRMHHSIVTMDWIGNFRFHWLETIVYQLLKFVPMAYLGARWDALLMVAVISTTIGHLNHSNLRISWGPLRYLLNSPRMHIWHHDRHLRGKAGVNFAVVFSAWDWLFGTAYMPMEIDQPDALGFGGMERVPTSLAMRFFAPMLDRRR